MISLPIPSAILLQFCCYSAAIASLMCRVASVRPCRIRTRDRKWPQVKLLRNAAKTSRISLHRIVFTKPSLIQMLFSCTSQLGYFSASQQRPDLIVDGFSATIGFPPPSQHRTPCLCAANEHLLSAGAANAHLVRVLG